MYIMIALSLIRVQILNKNKAMFCGLADAECSVNASTIFLMAAILKRIKIIEICFLRNVGLLYGFKMVYNFTYVYI